MKCEKEGSFMKKAFYWVLFSLSALLPFGLGWLINWLDALRAQTFDFSCFVWIFFSLAAGGAVIGSFLVLHRTVGKWFTPLLLCVIYVAYLILASVVYFAIPQNVYTLTFAALGAGLFFVEMLHSAVTGRNKQR